MGSLESRVSSLMTDDLRDSRNILKGKMMIGVSKRNGCNVIIIIIIITLCITLLYSHQHQLRNPHRHQLLTITLNYIEKENGNGAQIT